MCSPRFPLKRCSHRRKTTFFNKTRLKEWRKLETTKLVDMFENQRPNPRFGLPKGTQNDPFFIGGFIKSTLIGRGRVYKNRTCFWPRNKNKKKNNVSIWCSHRRKTTFSHKSARAPAAIFQTCNDRNGKRVLLGQKCLFTLCFVGSSSCDIHSLFVFVGCYCCNILWLPSIVFTCLYL